MSASLSLPDQIRQLNDAKKLVLGDVKYYPTVVQGILPIIGASAALELRRWGANFLSEAFGTPALAPAEKETMQLFVLDTLLAMLENAQEDAQVVRDLILTTASIYPFALRWNINNSYDEASWKKMTAIKNRILQIWPKAVTPVRIACIKLAQRIVLAQTTVTTDMRYGGGLDVSLDKVPANHQNLDRGALEGEAMGLLDRILSVLHENSSDALVVDATLNCLSILSRTRAATSTRIVNALLGFNPLKLAISSVTSTTRFLARSMEKTTRLLLIHLVKRDPHNPHNGRIQQHVDRLLRSRMDWDESRKRTMDGAPPEALDAKRQRLDPAPPPLTVAEIKVPPLTPPGPHSLADVFTITPYASFKTFDVSLVPVELASRISVSSLASLDMPVLAKAIDGIRARLAAMAEAPAPTLDPNTAPLGVDEEDDGYEPCLVEDSEQIMNRLDNESSEQPGSNRPTSGFVPPAMSPLVAEEQPVFGREAADRSLGRIMSLPEHAKRPARSGWGQPRPRAVSMEKDRDFWLRLTYRCVTRSLPFESTPARSDNPDREPTGLDYIRHKLYAYVLEDFRRRVDIAISWLNEEWVCDQKRRRAGFPPAEHYEYWTLRLMDGFVPYINAQDRLLTRFLSELPALDADMMARVKQICRDPSVVPLAVNSLLYVVMLKPPAKEAALDTLQEIWTEYDDAKPLAAKYLQKFRPGFLEDAKEVVKAEPEE